MVTFYNRRDEYRRTAIADEGDRSDWFALRHDVVVDIALSVAAGTDDFPDRPFLVSHAMSDPRAYAFQRQLFTMISQRLPVEPLGIEEGVIWLLENVLRAARAERDWMTQPDGQQQRNDLVHDAKILLSREFTRGMTVTELAGLLDASVFHLCRVFRRLTGCTLHEYRQQLRLRWSLEELVARPRRTLLECALDAGFCSHSHYGSAFKRAFGQTPSDFVRTTLTRSERDTSLINDRVSQLLARFRISTTSAASCGS